MVKIGRIVIHHCFQFVGFHSFNKALQAEDASRPLCALPGTAGHRPRKECHHKGGHCRDTQPQPNKERKK